MNISSQNEARRELLSVERQVVQINQELARNRQLALSADDAQKESLRTQSQKLAAERGVLRASQQGTRLRLRGLREEERALKQNTRQARLLGRSFAELGTAVGALAIGALTAELAQFTRNTVQASIQIDSLTRGLAALTGSTITAQRELLNIQELSDLPGLRFRQAADGAVALRAIGVEAETTTRILTELANAAAFTGTGGEFERGLLGFRQLIQRGRLSQEELNQLTENIGLASRVIRDEFGTVLAEDIQAQLDAAGQTVDDFVSRVLTGFERLERFPLDAPSVKLKNLSNSFFEFQAALGDRFLPIIARGAEFLTRFFDGFREYLNQINSVEEATQRYTASLMDLNTQLLNTESFTVRNQAIMTNIDLVREHIDVLERFAEAEGRRRGRITFSQRGIRDTSTLISEETLARIATTNEELENLRGVLEGSALSIDFFEGRAADLTDRISAQETTVAGLTREQRLLAIAGDTTSEAYQRLGRETAAAETTLSALRSEQERYNAIVGIAIANAGRLALATQLYTASQEQATQANENLFISVARANEQLRAARETIRSATGQDQGAAGLEAARTAINEQARIESELARERITNEEELAAELYSIEIDRQNALESATRSFNERQLRLSADRWEREVAIAQVSLDAINSRVQQAGSELASQLGSVNTVAQRRVLLDAINQWQDLGLSIDEVRERANALIPVLNSIPPAFNAVDAAQGRFLETLELQNDRVNRNRDSIFLLTQTARAYIQTLREAREDETFRLLLPERDADQREQDYFDRLQGQGGRTLGDVQREAGEEGNRFVNESRQRQEESLTQSLNRQDRLYVRFYQRIGGLASSALVDQLNIQNSFAESLLSEFANIFVRITALKLQEKLFDDNLTQAKILNQRRIQAEILNTQTVSQAGLGGGGAGALGGLGTLGLVGAGVGILGLIASLLGGGGASDVNRRVLNAERTSQNTTVVLRPSSEFARGEHYVTDSLLADGRA